MLSYKTTAFKIESSEKSVQFWCVIIDQFEVVDSLNQINTITIEEKIICCLSAICNQLKNGYKNKMIRKLNFM